MTNRQVNTFTAGLMVIALLSLIVLTLCWPIDEDSDFWRYWSFNPVGVGLHRYCCCEWPQHGGQCQCGNPLYCGVRGSPPCPCTKGAATP